MKLEHAQKLLDMGIKMTRAAWEDQAKAVCTIDTSPNLYFVDSNTNRPVLFEEIATDEDWTATDWEVVRVIK